MTRTVRMAPLALALCGCSLLAPDRDDFLPLDAGRPPPPPPDLVWEGPAEPTCLAIAEDVVYMSDRAGGTPGAGRLLEVAKDGSGFRAIASGLDSPMRVALTVQDIYWTTGGTQGSVKHAPKSSGSPVESIGSASAPALSIALQGTHAYWTVPDRGVLFEDAVSIATEDSANIHGIAVAPGGGLAFYTSYDGGFLERFDLTTRQKTRTVEDLVQPAGVVVFGNDVVWIEESDTPDGRIQRMGVDALANKPTVLVAGVVTSQQLAVDGTGIYWATRTQLLRLPPGGNVPLPIAEGLEGCGAGVAVDPADERVYWACRADDGTARIYSQLKL